MISLRVAGVPEHFNLPWHLLLESGGARALGLDAAWRDVPEGSGAMAAALEDGACNRARPSQGDPAGIQGLISQSGM